MFGARGVALGLGGGGGVKFKDFLGGSGAANVRNFNKFTTGTARYGNAGRRNFKKPAGAYRRRKRHVTSWKGGVKIDDDDDQEDDKQTDGILKKNLFVMTEQSNQDLPPPPTAVTSTINQPTEPLEKETTKTTTKIKIHLEPPPITKTFWIACRAVIFGTILVTLGTAMSTIGYYHDYFAGELHEIAINVTEITVTETRRIQFKSLAYVGPVVMGVGAFVLMMACVTTLEGRDTRARLLELQQKQLELEQQLQFGEKGPIGTLSRHGTLKKSIHKRPTCLKQPPINKQDSNNNQGQNQNQQQQQQHQTAELIAVGGVGESSPNYGVVNRSFIKDESKSNSASGPSHQQQQQQQTVCYNNNNSTTTTTLTTWSKNGGASTAITQPAAITQTGGALTSDAQQQLILTADNINNPKLFASASCIDNLMKKTDSRALLQRFLEDQSRLVEDRLNRRQQLLPVLSPTTDTTAEDLDRAPVRIFQSNRNGRNVVAVDVHRPGDCSPAAGVGIGASNKHNVVVVAVDASKNNNNYLSPAVGGVGRAPIIAPDMLESFSPMSITPDTPANRSRLRAISGGGGGGDRRYQQDLPSNSTYATPAVMTSDDFFNGNYQNNQNNNNNRQALFPGSYSANFDNYYNRNNNNNNYYYEKSSSNSAGKLYDSVFLAENLRRLQQQQQFQSYQQQYCTSAPLTRRRPVEGEIDSINRSNENRQIVSSKFNDDFRNRNS